MRRSAEKIQAGHNKLDPGWVISDFWPTVRRIRKRQNRLRGELDKAGIEYQWMLKRDEYHGFYKIENKVEFYDQALAFIKQHTGI